MKIKEITCRLILTALLTHTSLTVADNSSSEESSADEAIYGIVDATYPEESRVVIDDMSIQYNDQSDFKNLFGRTLSGTEKGLKKGVAVRYRLGNQGKTTFIQELEVISKRKYQFETTRQHADEH